MSKKIYVGSEKVFDADDYEVAGAVASHAAAADPHPGYLTPAEGNAAYDATGTATAAVSNHNGSAAAHGLNVAATVGALPMPDAGNYFPGDDTLGTQMQSVGSQLAQILNPETWIAPTLLNSFAIHGGNAVGYRKDANGNVHLKGGLNTGASGAIAFTLPSGYRPTPNTKYFPCYTIATGNNSVSVSTDGSVTVISYTSYVFLDSISFPTT